VEGRGVPADLRDRAATTPRCGKSAARAVFCNPMLRARSCFLQVSARTHRSASRFQVAVRIVPRVLRSVRNPQNFRASVIGFLVATGLLHLTGIAMSAHQMAVGAVLCLRERPLLVSCSVSWGSVLGTEGKTTRSSRRSDRDCSTSSPGPPTGSARRFAAPRTMTAGAGHPAKDAIVVLQAA
jgi:hypothetical protein